MTDRVWSVERDRISALFGQSPRAEDEGAVCEVFRFAPVRVLAVAAELEAGVASGSIRSGWAVLRKRLGESRPDVTVSDAPDLARRTLAAERWVRNAGIYFEREAQVVGELFEPGGLLAPFAHAVFEKDSDVYAVTGDAGLVDRMLGLWREQRPRGVKAENASLAWQEQLRVEIQERWRFERVLSERAKEAELVVEMDEERRAAALAGLAP